MVQFDLNNHFQGYAEDQIIFEENSVVLFKNPQKIYMESDSVRIQRSKNEGNVYKA